MITVLGRCCRNKSVLDVSALLLGVSFRMNPLIPNGRIKPDAGFRICDPAAFPRVSLGLSPYAAVERPSQGSR